MTKDYEPKWAKRLEDWGKEIEAKCSRCSSGEKSEPKDSSRHDSNNKVEKDSRPKWQRENNPVGEIVGNIISYFIVTYVPAYFPGFFLEGFSAVRTVILLSIAIHILVSLVLLILPLRPLYYLGHTIMNIAGLASMVVMVTIFPFNFSGTIGTIVQFALWVAIVIVAIVTIFEFLNIFGNDTQYDI